MTNWQPIATAPRGRGVEIIGYAYDWEAEQRLRWIEGDDEFPAYWAFVESALCELEPEARPDIWKPAAKLPEANHD